MFYTFFLLVDSMNFFQWSFGSFYCKYTYISLGRLYICIYLLLLISFHRILQGSLRVVYVDHKWKTTEAEMKTWDSVITKFCW